MNRFFTKSLVLVALVGAITAFATSKAQAAEICVSCSYIGPVGTYIGTYDPTQNDTGDFRHTLVAEGTPIDDRWVFDIAPAGDGSVSADFTLLAPWIGFSGGLYEAGATTCGDPTTPSGCTVADLGNLVAAANLNGQQIATGVVSLTAGRYIFQVLGTAGDPFGSYTGQLSTAAVPEPALLSLLGLGLVAAANHPAPLAQKYGVA